MADATVTRLAEAPLFLAGAFPSGEGYSLEPWPFATLHLVPVSSGGLAIPGLETLPSLLRATGITGGSLLCIAPGEALLVRETGADFPENGGLAENLFIEISHSMTGFHLSGTRAEALLALGCPLDMQLPAFPVGMVTRTVFAKFDLILWRTGPVDFRLLVARSVSFAFVAHLDVVFPQVAA